VGAEGVLHNRAEVATPSAEGPEAVFDRIETLARAAAHGVPAARIAGLGLCAPGPLDPEAGVALATPTLPGFVDLDLAAALRARLPWPVTLENDGVAAALGEWRHGAGQGVDNMVFVTVSTGIGGGVVADGRVLRGRRGMAGHLGHMKMTDSAERCFCGDTGCWEAVASGSALERRAAARLGRPARAAEVFAAAAAGEPPARALVADLAGHLATGIVGLIHLFSPERVVLGGGVMAAFDQLAPAIRAGVEARAMAPFRGVSIRPAALRGDAGLRGMACRVLETGPAVGG